MVDVASRFGIDQGYAGLAIEMAGEIGEFFGEHFEDRRVDLNSANPAGAEEQTGKDVTTAAHANDSDVGRRLHEVGCIDDIIFQVGELSDVAIIPGDDRACIGIDVEVVLVDPSLRSPDQTPAKRDLPGQFPHPYPRIGIPAFEQRAGLLSALGPEHTEMASTGQVKAGVHGGRDGQR